ncbi:PepSY-like domain-containing protein [Aequorivita flava]|uniref:PepSY-like domain-containing protein n=1 Tax=Aequorivita flava TaxID=3114371 RepID=A0AB35YR91_9FLAO
MKTFSLALCALVLTVSSCSNNDDAEMDTTLSEAEIPVEIKTYVDTHFAPNSINRAIRETENNEVSYDVFLNENIILEFNGDLEITAIDDDSQLPNSVIPNSILEYVAQNYASNFITDWELENNHQQVELNNGTELEFTLNGEFIRIDND